MYSISQYAGPDIRWVDGQKPLFQVNLELVSTVTARDQHLHNFFLHMAKLNETRSLAALFPSASEVEAHKAIDVRLVLRGCPNRNLVSNRTAAALIARPEMELIHDTWPIRS